jgi:hypothetical protein
MKTRRAVSVLEAIVMCQKPYELEAGACEVNSRGFFVVAVEKIHQA